MAVSAELQLGGRLGRTLKKQSAALETHRRFLDAAKVGQEMTTMFLSQRRFWVLLLVAVLTARLGAWLVITGSFKATVVDSTGAAIPNATVTLSNVASGFKREVVTSDAGSFVFDGVRPGSYQLAIFRTGFDLLNTGEIKVRGTDTQSLGSLKLHFKFSPPSGGRNSGQWNWKDSSEKTRSKAELDEILRKHWQWLESGATVKRLDEDTDLETIDPSPWRQSTNKELVGASLVDALLERVILSRADLHNAHLDVAYLEYANLSVADLAGATLTHADLLGTDLRHVTMDSNTTLQDAMLPNADLRDADMSEAHFEGASLIEADLRGAHMHGTHLNGAHLSYADLTGADLSGADLSNAELARTRTLYSVLPGANLTDVNLGGAKLDGAIWGNTNVSNAIFEPASLPKVSEFSQAENMELLTYEGNPAALVQIRKLFEDGGFHQQERKITHALKQTEARHLWNGCKQVDVLDCVAYLFNKVFFDLTCQYGMNPSRPLELGVVLWSVCSILYLICIHGSGEAALYRTYAHGIEPATSGPREEERIKLSPVRETGLKRILQLSRREWSVFRTSMFFSLMSAFNIGFRDMNFGRWIGLLTRQEFAIKAKGWARVIAGWQSLVSVYLIALWVLTYFGHLFE